VPSCGSGCWDENYRQLHLRHAAPFVRDVLRRFRARELTVSLALAELGLGRTRFYELYASYLAACAKRRASFWSPASSGGNQRAPLPEPVAATLRKLLTSAPPCSYSLAASEALRRHDFTIDRATVRRWALREGLAPLGPHKKAPRPVRRWQVQQIGQLWQYDASPHRWFHGQDRQPSLLEIIDDHSRVIPGARLYERENLPAHLHFLPAAFRAHGLPLALYVDYHSFFFTSTPDALTQLGSALRFYEISLRYAPTPQAKGKIERAHDFWQKRLPPLFASEHIATLPEANLLLEKLRLHHNAKELHRELRSTPQAAWNLALAQKRSVLRPAPNCPWWPHIWSQRSQAKVGPDQRISIGSQRLRIERPCGSSVTRCLHPNGDASALLHPPAHGQLPILLLHLPAPNTPVRL
jgi:hypothetical protein